MKIPTVPENERITIKLKGVTLIVHFPNQYRSKQWGDSFGIVQECLETSYFEGTRFTGVQFDFQNLIWIDPIPLLSLLLIIKMQREKYETIKYFLPEVKSSNDASTTSHRAMSFLLKEKFVDLMLDQGIVYFGSKEVKSMSLHENQFLEPALLYKDSSVIPATLVDTYNYPNNLETLVSELMNTAQKNLIGKNIPRYHLPKLKYRLRLLLSEKISNVQKHAYPHNTSSLVGIYVRFRHGLQNTSLDGPQRNALKAALNREHFNNPRLNKEFFETRFAGIEVFVIDIGIGLVSTMGTHALSEACANIFLDGQRGKNSKTLKQKATIGHTEKGGLFLIGQVLNRNRDYLHVFDHGQIVGDFLLFKREKLQQNNYFHSHFPIENKNVRALAWNFRISWKDTTVTKFPRGWYRWQGKISENPVSRYYYDSAIDLRKNREDHRIYDFRFPEPNKRQDAEPNPKTSEDVIKSYSKFSAKKTCMVLFPPLQEKHDIWTRLDKISSSLEIEPGRTLIIADIPEDEFLTYHVSFDNPILSSLWTKRFDKVILVTRRLATCVYITNRNSLSEISDKGAFRLDPNLSESFAIKDPISLPFDPTQSLAHLVSWIRFYDSHLFWVTLGEKQHTQTAFVNAPIKWNNELSYIEGYLDFTQTMTEPILKSIYFWGLERVIGLGNDGNCNFDGMDILTRELVKEANLLLTTSRIREECITIHIGSVFVTGQKERDHMFGVMQDSGTPRIHFFVHGSSVAKPMSILIWPKKSWLKQIPKTSDTFERIGRTHVIAKDGWRAFPMPRYNEIDECAYYRNPHDSYEDWQNPEINPCKMGNFDYEGTSDLFKIDIRESLEYSFEFQKELAEFLVVEFFLALGGNRKEQLRGVGKAFWEKIEVRMGQENHYSNIGLIVYVNHPNSSYAIEKIKECIDPHLTSRIFPLVPTTKTREGGALLISPLSFTQIKKCIDSDAKQEVVLFDASVISGRTRKELKHLLFYLGAKEVQTISIVNRNRLPYNPANPIRHRSYWRLDIPRLGHSSSNPLTSAIRLAQTMAPKIIFGGAKERVGQWHKIWGPIAAGDDHEGHGIMSTPLEISRKKFGIKENPDKAGEYLQIGGETNKIAITNSTGLAIYCAELLAMTGRDDLALNLLKGSYREINPSAKIELLASQLLLFPTEVPREVTQEMLEQLLLCANQIETHDNHTALAALVFLAQEPIHKEALVKKLLQSSDSKEKKVNNLDLSIAFAIIVDEICLEDDTEYLGHISRILGVRGEQRYLRSIKQFHSEIYTEHGIMHMKPLNALFTKTDTDIRHRINNVLYSFAIVIHLIERELHAWTLRLPPGSMGEESLIDQRNNCLLMLHNCQTEAANIMNELSLDFEPTENLQNRCNSLCATVKEDLLPSLIKTIHSGYLIQVLQNGSTKIDGGIRHQISELVQSIKNEEVQNDAKIKGMRRFFENEPVFKMSQLQGIFPPEMRSRKNIWAIVDNSFGKEIKYLIQNVVYSTKAIPDPWIDGGEEFADMWLNIQFDDPKYVKLILVNAADKDSALIQKQYDAKTTYEKMIIADLGGSIKFTNLEIKSEKLIKTTIMIPYI